MAFVDDYAVFLENVEQTITARNTEEYLVENPGPFPLPPDPAYAVQLPAAADQFEDLVAQLAGGPAMHGAVLTTGTSGGDLGRATLTYPAMTTPIISVEVVDATQDNTYFQVAIESVSSTQAVVRVTSASGLTLLGIPLLSLPSLAAGATVHVIAYDAG